MIEIADESVAHAAQKRGTAHHPAADEGAAHPGLGPHFRGAAGREPHGRLGLVGRRPGNQVHRAADNVAAVERPLRSAEHFDSLEVQKVSEQTRRAGQVDPVEIHGGTRVGPGKDGIGADAANGQLGEAGVLGEGDRGTEAGEVLDGVGVPARQLGGLQRAHGHRDRVQIALAAPGRGDDGVLLQRHLQGLRHFGGFTGAYPDAATRGHEAGCCRGQIVVPVGQISNLESPFSIGPPGPFHGSADGDGRVGQTSAGRVGYHPGDGAGRLRGRWISCPENDRQDGRKPHPGAAVDHTSIMCAGYGLASGSDRESTKAPWRAPCRFGTCEGKVERETGIEPATSSLGSSRSTAELLPRLRDILAQ